MLGPVRYAVWLLFYPLFITCASAALVTLQFAGQVSGTSGINLKVGSWMTGCFTYDSAAPDMLQSGPNAIVTFSIPEEDFHFERRSFGLGIYNNWNMGHGDPLIDGVALSFGYPLGYGTLSLRSSDLSLFPDATLPSTLPSLNKFDLGGGIDITEDQVQPYRSAAIRFDHFREFTDNLPAPKLSCQVLAEQVELQFSADPTLNYIVETADSLSPSSWTTLTEVAGIAGTIKVAKAPGQRFFRLRQIPCECLE